MKTLLYILVIFFTVTSCGPYSITSSKKFVSIKDSYEKDTLYLEDVLICGTLYNIKYLTLFKSHPILYAMDSVMGLLVQNISEHAPLVFETGENKFSYYLCSNSIESRNNKRTIEELKFLFPQKDDKIRVVPHFNFVKEIDVRKIAESINLAQSVFFNIYIIKNGDIIYMNNKRLWSQYRLFYDMDDYTFPFYELELVDKIIREALKDYFERVES